MSPVLTRPRPRSHRTLVPSDVVLIAVAAVLGIAAVLGTYAALRGPGLVDRVRVVNETPYLLDVEVTGATRSGWLDLGPISPGETHDFDSVVDQGDRWVFHVTTGSHDGDEFSMTRAELERARWHVTIPPNVRSRLEVSGAVPHPNM
jgi:hypothetical protein